MVFTLFLKDNEHIVIAIENNGIIVTGAFFRVFFSMLNKGNLPVINAYCYAVETIGRLHSVL